MKNLLCDVEVDTHAGPFWKDKNSDIQVCSKHKKEYDKYQKDLGPFAWELIDRHVSEQLEY